MSGTRILSYILCIMLCVALIYIWNRGAQRRRFTRVFGRQSNPAWTPENIPFLAALETAYGLRRGQARALPPETTPMALYLTLYPTHCIYDNAENDRFIAALKTHLSKLPNEVLTQPLAQLARAWQQAADVSAK